MTPKIRKLRAELDRLHDKLHPPPPLLHLLVSPEFGPPPPSPHPFVDFSAAIFGAVEKLLMLCAIFEIAAKSCRMLLVRKRLRGRLQRRQSTHLG